MKTLAATLCTSPRCRRTPDKSDVDPRPAADGLRTCWVCRDRTAELLAAVPSLYAECETMLARTTGTFEKVGGSTTPGLPLDLGVADVRADILGVLAAWASLVVDERGLVPLGLGTVASLAQFLDGHLDWLAAHPAAGDWCDELADLVRRADRVLDPDTTRRSLVSTCVMDDCPGQLWALLRDVDDTRPSAITCDAEQSHTWQPDRWLDLGTYLKFRAVA
ncbi:hypothetical protein AB0M43_33575 [Longispora sp. NPDC051575]|uniref:hypothetical protein n=1 Tax=Longispora sp. NPDC051575 TaxID=3154943 RepID=UPI003445DDDE